MPGPISPIDVLFLAYPGMSLLDLIGPMEALQSVALHRSCPAGYQCTLASVDGGPVQTFNGVGIDTVALGDVRTSFRTVIVPGAIQPDQIISNTPLIDWLRENAGRADRVCSICAGSFILAEAGLLRDRRATTHWFHCDRLGAEYERVEVDADAIFVRDGRIWTSAGVTTGIDLALALIEEDFGRELAMFVARVLVVYLRRTGGQSQYSALLSAQTSSSADLFAELERWILENPAEDLRVERLAERAGMSPRNFARRYHEARKATPARAVEAIRVEAARRILEERDLRLVEVAHCCGFSDETHLRKAFHRQLGISPSDYRERFASRDMKSPTFPNERMHHTKAMPRAC